MTDLAQPIVVSTADTDMEPTETADTAPWTIVASASAVPYDRGVAALVEGEPVAVFRLSPIAAAPSSFAHGEPERPDEWYAVSHVDPVTGAPVMARGLVGSLRVADAAVAADAVPVPTVASPLHKHRYNLRTGACIDNDSLALQSFQVSIVDDLVLVR